MSATACVGGTGVRVRGQFHRGQEQEGNNSEKKSPCGARGGATRGRSEIGSRGSRQIKHACRWGGGGLGLLGKMTEDLRAVSRRAEGRSPRRGHAKSVMAMAPLARPFMTALPGVRITGQGDG